MNMREKIKYSEEHFIALYLKLKSKILFKVLKPCCTYFAYEPRGILRPIIYSVMEIY